MRCRSTHRHKGFLMYLLLLGRRGLGAKLVAGLNLDELLGLNTLGKSGFQELLFEQSWGSEWYLIAHSDIPLTRRACCLREGREIDALVTGLKSRPLLLAMI